MRHLAPFLALSLFVGFLGGVIGATAYNKIVTPKVLGTNTHQITKESPEARTDFEDISFVSPKGAQVEKGESGNSKYIKFTGNNKIISIEKDKSTVKQIQRDLDCKGKTNCDQVTFGRVTYTKETAPDASKYTTAKDTSTIIIKFANFTKEEQQSFLNTLSWL